MKIELIEDGTKGATLTVTRGEMQFLCAACQIVANDWRKDNTSEASKTAAAALDDMATKILVSVFSSKQTKQKYEAEQARADDNGMAQQREKLL